MYPKIKQRKQKGTNPMRRSRRKNRAIRSDGRDFCDAPISTELKPISNLIIPQYI
jgi:hypothetical protein